MANVLNEEKKQQVLAPGRLGWRLRQIQKATRIRRETASQYLKAAGIAVRPPGGWGRRGAKPTNEGITDSEVITHLSPFQRDEVGALFLRSKLHLHSAVPVRVHVKPTARS